MATGTVKIPEFMPGDLFELPLPVFNRNTGLFPTLRSSKAHVDGLGTESLVIITKPLLFGRFEMYLDNINLPFHRSSIVHIRSVGYGVC